MTSQPPDDDLTARLRAARPGGNERDLGEEACLARVEAIQGPPRRVTVGRFVVEGEIGKGGYGQVFRARDPRFDQVVALKRLHGGAARSVRSAALALREARHLSNLNHPNIVKVHDVLDLEDDTYIVMEFVDGEPLSRWQQQPRAWQEVLSVYLQAGDGLAAAHAAGVLHFDLKPGNILVGRDGRVRVVDFGLAREVAPLTSAQAEVTLEEAAPPRGTIPYSSPEQRTCGEVDQRSDLYSFCVALFQALHGRLPFSASELAEMRYAAFEPAAATPRGRVPARIESALRRGLATEADRRWPDMASLLAQLRRPAWFQRRLVWAMTGASLVAVPFAVAFPARPAVCDETDELGDVWNDDARSRVAAAFANSDAPYAEKNAASVRSRLDAYAQQWESEMQATCAVEPTNPPDPSVQLRLSCLRRSRGRLERVAMMFAEGAPEVIERADDVIRQLTPPRACEPPTRGQGAPPSNAPMEVLAAVDRARLSFAVGRLDEARSASERAMSLAVAVEDPAGSAEAHLVRGELLADAGETPDAVSSLENAAVKAIEAGREDIAARAWTTLARVAIKDLEDTDRAQGWLRFAEAATTRLDSDHLARADLLDVRGRYKSLLGDPVAAEADHREALTELEQVLEADDPRWAETWMSLAGVRLARGDIAGAEEFDRRTLELRERRLGPDHPEIAKALISLAIVARERGEGAAAFADLTRALTILERNYGAESVRLAPVLTLQAEILVVMGELARAQATASRAWSLQRKHLPIDHVERKEGALSILAQIAGLRGDFLGALAAYQIARQEASAREDVSAIPIVENNIAWNLAVLGRYAEAGEVYSAIRDNRSSDGLLRTYALIGLGWCALKQGNTKLAIARLEAASLELEGTGPVDAPGLAEVRWRLAEALLQSNKHFERARVLAQGALGYYERISAFREAASLRTLLEGVERSRTHRKEK